jgi:hypothetical protein
VVDGAALSTSIRHTNRTCECVQRVNNEVAPLYSLISMFGVRERVALLPSLRTQGHLAVAISGDYTVGLELRTLKPPQYSPEGDNIPLRAQAVRLDHHVTS